MGRSFFGQETEALGADALGGAREAGGGGIRLDGGAHHLVEAARQRAGETPAHLAVALDHVGELRHLAGERLVEAPADKINQGFVLGNKVMVGTVNSHHDDFAEGVQDMLRAEAFFPGWLERLVTKRIEGLAALDQIREHFRDDGGAIKAVVEVAS